MSNPSHKQAGIKCREDAARFERDKQYLKAATAWIKAADLTRSDKQAEYCLRRAAYCHQQTLNH